MHDVSDLTVVGIKFHPLKDGIAPQMFKYNCSANLVYNI